MNQSTTIINAAAYEFGRFFLTERELDHDIHEINKTLLRTKHVLVIKFINKRGHHGAMFVLTDASHGDFATVQEHGYLVSTNNERYGWG